jgi:hypothetical protein
MHPKSPLIKRAKPTSFEQRHMKNEIALRPRGEADQAATSYPFML